MQKNSLIYLFLLMFAVALPQASFAAGKFPQQVKDMVAAAKKDVPMVDMATLKSKLGQKDVLVIDVREPNEYAAGHIPGAINIPRGIIEFKIWKKVGYPENTNMDIEMYLYCKAGSRCALAAKSLKDLGFTKVHGTDMKLKQWSESGNQLVK